MSLVLEDERLLRISLLKLKFKRAEYGTALYIRNNIEVNIRNNVEKIMIIATMSRWLHFNHRALCDDKLFSLNYILLVECVRNSFIFTSILLDR